MAKAVFRKPLYGRQRKHMLSSITDFDRRPEQYRGTAPVLVEEFLGKVKRKSLGVSLLNDKDARVWKNEENKDEDVAVLHSYNIPSN